MTATPPRIRQLPLGLLGTSFKAPVMFWQSMTGSGYNRPPLPFGSILYPMTSFMFKVGAPWSQLSPHFPHRNFCCAHLLHFLRRKSLPLSPTGQSTSGQQCYRAHTREPHNQAAKKQTKALNVAQITQWLRALAVLEEIPSSVPTTIVRWLTTWNSSSGKSDAIF